MIRFHPHALKRLTERGTTEAEVIETVQNGEQFPTKFGRTGFRKEFRFSGTWRGRFYEAKQVEAFAVPQEDDWLVITVVTRYY
jgi:hypothetical protein